MAAGISRRIGDLSMLVAALEPMVARLESGLMMDHHPHLHRTARLHPRMAAGISRRIGDLSMLVAALELMVARSESGLMMDHHPHLHRTARLHPKMAWDFKED